MKKIIIFSIIIVLIMGTVLFGVRKNIQNVPPSLLLEEPITEITSTTASYISEMGEEAIVEYYNNDTAILNLLNTEYKNILLEIGMSASGARYENKDLGLVVWEKSPEITIYKNDQPIFSGKKREEVTKEQIKKILPFNKWVWEKTIDGVGPLSSDKDIIIPKKPDAFTISFNSDGQINGTTDCNNFAGTYSIENDSSIKFGSFMSTLMFCDGSQESEFINMIKNGNIYVSEDQIILENNQTIYFKKTE